MLVERLVGGHWRTVVGAVVVVQGQGRFEITFITDPLLSIRTYDYDKDQFRLDGKLETKQVVGRSNANGRLIVDVVT